MYTLSFKEYMYSYSGSQYSNLVLFVCLWIFQYPDRNPENNGSVCPSALFAQPASTFCRLSGQSSQCSINIRCFSVAGVNFYYTLLINLYTCCGIMFCNPIFHIYLSEKEKNILNTTNWRDHGHSVMQHFTGTKADLVHRRNDKGLHTADDKTKIPSKKERKKLLTLLILLLTAKFMLVTYKT